MKEINGVKVLFIGKGKPNEILEQIQKKIDEGK